MSVEMVTFPLLGVEKGDLPHPERVCELNVPHDGLLEPSTRKRRAVYFERNGWSGDRARRSPHFSSHGNLQLVCHYRIPSLMSRQCDKSSRARRKSSGRDVSSFTRAPEGRVSSSESAWRASRVKPSSHGRFGA